MHYFLPPGIRYCTDPMMDETSYEDAFGEATFNNRLTANRTANASKVQRPTAADTLRRQTVYSDQFYNGNESTISHMRRNPSAMRASKPSLGSTHALGNGAWQKHEPYVSRRYNHLPQSFVPHKDQYGSHRHHFDVARAPVNINAMYEKQWMDMHPGQNPYPLAGSPESNAEIKQLLVETSGVPRNGYERWLKGIANAYLDSQSQAQKQPFTVVRQSFSTPIDSSWQSDVTHSFNGFSARPAPRSTNSIRYVSTGGVEQFHSPRSTNSIRYVSTGGVEQFQSPPQKHVEVPAPAKTLGILFRTADGTLYHEKQGN